VLHLVRLVHLNLLVQLFQVHQEALTDPEALEALKLLGHRFLQYSLVGPEDRQVLALLEDQMVQLDLEDQYPQKILENQMDPDFQEILWVQLVLVLHLIQGVQRYRSLLVPQLARLDLPLQHHQQGLQVQQALQVLSGPVIQRCLYHQLAPEVPQARLVQVHR